LRLLNTAVDRDWTLWLPIYAWLIKHAEGPILVDTGETARAGTGLLSGVASLLSIGCDR
jgi:hypothetical protein